MEIHQLRYLVAVVDEGSFTAAGRREHVSQSGVSAQIKQLERELGSPLLDRSGRTVTLTDLGEAVLPHARAALRAVAQIDDAVDEVAGLLRGSVNLGMVTGCSIPGVMDALATVHRAHPTLTVTLVEGPSDWLQRRVLGGDLDLALVGYATRADPGLREGIVIDEPLVAVVPNDDALAGRADVTLSELAARVVLSLPAGTGVRFALDAAIAAHAPDVRVALEASAPVTVAGLAARGLGVAVVSASMVAEDVRLTALPITEPALHSCLSLVWPDRAHLSAASRAVLSALVEALGARAPAR